MGFGDQPQGQPDRIGGSWQLRRVSRVVVNGNEDEAQTLYQKDSHKGAILSSPLKLMLREGTNTIAVGGANNTFNVRGADLERVVVYPAEEDYY